MPIFADENRCYTYSTFTGLELSELLYARQGQRARNRYSLESVPNFTRVCISTTSRVHHDAWK